MMTLMALNASRAASRIAIILAALFVPLSGCFSENGGAAEPAIDDVRIDMTIPVGVERVLPGTLLRFEVSLPPGLADQTSWEFGDGATGHGAAVSHAYQDAGSYLVRVAAGPHEGSKRVGVWHVAEYGGTAPLGLRQVTGEPMDHSQHDLVVREHSASVMVNLTFEPRVFAEWMAMRIVDDAGETVESHMGSPPLEIPIPGGLPAGQYALWVWVEQGVQPVDYAGIMEIGYEPPV